MALYAIGSALGGPIGAAIGVAIATGLNSLDKPNAPPPANQVESQKQSIPPRTHAYGRSRLHPYYALYQTAKNGTTVDIYAFADGQADGVETVYINDEVVTLSGNNVQQIGDGKYSGNRVKAGWTLGAAINTAFSNIVSLLPGIWTNNHRGDGVVTGYLTKDSVKEKDFLKVYPQGDNAVMSLVARWQLCFDPRTGNTAWTENPVLQLLHYITVRRGYDYNTRILPTLQYWINAANICDEAVPLRSGGTEPRYRSCVSYSALAQPKEVYGSLLETFDGWMAPRGDGALIVYAGKVYQPTVTIGPDDIVGYRFQNEIEDENWVDQLSVSYVSALHDWNTVEATPWAGDAGAARSDSISPQTPSFSQARRLAKRKFALINANNRGNVTTNIGGRRARGHRYIYLDLAEEGFDPFEGIKPIVEIQTLTRDFMAGGVSFDWIRVDPAVDSWNPATEEGYPAAKGDTVTQDALVAPTIVSVTPTYGQNTAYNTPGVKLTIVVNGPNRSDLTWYVRTKASGAAVYIEQQYPDIDAGASVTLQTDFLPLGMVDVGVAYSVGDGRVSPYASPPTVNTGGVPPDPLTGLGVSANTAGTLITADWDETRFATRYLVELIV